MIFSTKKQNYIEIVVTAIFVVLLLSFSLAQAETLMTSSSVSAKMRPKYPGANEKVKITIESYSVDLNRNEVYWYKNGVLKNKGIGLKEFFFTSTSLGDYDVITVQIGDTITKNITVSPAEVDLIWESDSSVPPFYKGKALSSHRDDIKIVAIPHVVSSNGVEIDSKKLIYKWKRDWKVLGSLSGYGKDTLVVNGEDMFRESTITVEVESVDSSLKAVGNINIDFYEPKVVFYEDNPVLGVVYNNALTDGFNLDEEEMVVFAQPFFFSRGDELEYNWKMNNKYLNDSKNNRITFRQDGKDTGMTNLGLEIRNLNRIMQFAKSSFDLYFSGIESQSFFGSNR